VGPLWLIIVALITWLRRCAGSPSRGWVRRSSGLFDGQVWSRLAGELRIPLLMIV
jgi:hypothetical protein